MAVLQLADLFKNVTTEKEPISYVNYWAELSPSFVSSYIKEHEIETNCASECKVCQITHIAKYRQKYSKKPSDSLRLQALDPTAEASHPWQITCPFIPEDYSSQVPAAVLATHSASDIDDLICIKDPVKFAIKYFAWEPRKHQELALRCQSKRKVYRWGRRAGKSEVFAIELLWHAFTKSKTYSSPDSGEILKGLKILVIAPYESQIMEVFDKIMLFLNRSEATKDSIKSFKRSPFHFLELKNGCQIKGFTTGAHDAESLRGQDGHVVFLDEADYMSDGDFKTILPIVNSHPDVLIRAASTPAGKREKYYNWCVEQPQWKEFYFPTPVVDETPVSQIGTNWKRMRADIRGDYSTDGWLQEVMAIFIASANGVYQPGFISNAQRDYQYKDMTNQKISGTLAPGWRFSVGVDWNSNAGTWICILGHHPSVGFKVMDIVNVPKQDFTQYKGLQKVTEIFSLWQPEYIYLDAGHGASNFEMLNLWSMEQPAGTYERSVETRMKKFEFGGKVEIRDPASGILVKHPAKAFMVESSVRKFEDGVISFSKDDDTLRKQLLNYIIQSRSESGKPIYGCENESIGDHALDALNLSIVSFVMEESVLGPQANLSNARVGVLGSAMHMLKAQSEDSNSPVLRPNYLNKGAREALISTSASVRENISGRSRSIISEESPDLNFPRLRENFLNDMPPERTRSVGHIKKSKAKFTSRTGGL